jgi:predicted O-methyltransferase YrrM
MTPEEIKKILEIPEWDSVSAIKQTEAEYIYQFVKEKNLTRTLETGFAFARSASHIMAATGQEHITIDPYQDHYKNMGLTNVERLGLSGKLKFIPDFSHNVLPKLLDEKKTFDFIFIDGSHTFDGIFVDFYYANLLLEKNGYIMLHDTWMRSTRLVESYVKTNLKHFRQVPSPLRNICIFQKIEEDKRDGMVFKEFYTSKSYLVYKLIIWMTTGKQTVFKKLAIKLKNLLK